MTFKEWLEEGFKNGYCSLPICDTHDDVPLHPTETLQFEQNKDICITIVRIFETPQQADAIRIANEGKLK